MAHPTATPEVLAAGAEITLLRGLSLMDSVLLMVGGVIGSGIFLTAAPIANAVHKPLYFLGIWILGGLISLLACFAFAEMAAMYPELDRWREIRSELDPGDVMRSDQARRLGLTDGPRRRAAEADER